MLDLNSIDSREDFKWDLITRAAKDREFCTSLKRNPHAVLEQELGKERARDVAIEVHQEKPREIYFLINYNPNLPKKADQIQIHEDDNPEAVLVKKAWKDPQYRKELLRDPPAKFKSEFGRPLPGDATLKVLEEESPNRLHLILPAFVYQQELGGGSTSELELSADELNQVAGGMDCIASAAWAWLTKKIVGDPKPPSGQGSTSSCGCNSSSGVRG